MNFIGVGLAVIGCAAFGADGHTIAAVGMFGFLFAAMAS